MLYTLIGANLLMFAVFGLTFSKLPPLIPLFYSRPAGEQQLVEWWFIFLIPVFMNGLYVLNVVMEKKLFDRNSFVTTLLTVMKWIVILASTAIFLKIIFLVT